MRLYEVLSSRTKGRRNATEAHHRLSKWRAGFIQTDEVRAIFSIYCVVGPIFLRTLVSYECVLNKFISSVTLLRSIQQTSRRFPIGLEPSCPEQARVFPTSIFYCCYIVKLYKRTYFCSKLETGISFSK